MRLSLGLLSIFACVLLWGCVPSQPVGDDDTSGDDDDTSGPTDADGDGWDDTVDCDDSDPALNLDDADNDGYDTCNGDCNDGNGAINPLATDVVGDGVDQNCDGIDGTDGDGDGYAADWSSGDDCDDADATIYPGAPDPCDGIDQDCAGDLEAEADDDGDGFRVCEDDCDDFDDTIHPGATEVACDGIDNDCDGAQHDEEIDDDGDGHTECDGDCDDTSADVYPGAYDECGNNLDDDCDGTLDETCVFDSFVQAGNMMADILWVVDNSCSMWDEQGFLGDEAATFFDALDALGIDYQVAVVTTDSNTFKGPVPIMSTTTPGLYGSFEDAVSLGTSGSGTEQGFKYGSEAITAPLAAPGGPHDGFLRERAGLRVIFVSDEDDQSSDTVTNYVDLLQAITVNPEHTMLSGITGQATGCATAYAAARYEQAVSLTGGLSESICVNDWETMVEGLAAHAEHHADTFVLSDVPVGGTLEVFVNGVAVGAGWSYDPALNAVVFDWASVPDNGDVVEIGFAT